MNRRTLVQTIAVAGSVSLAGCEQFLYGEDGNESVMTANTELSKATTMLKNIELVVDEEIDISSDDFGGYSPEDVTQHTEAADESLADDDSDAGEILLVVSTVLEETARQYESIDGVFTSMAEFRQRYLDGDFEDAIRAGDRFATRLSEVTSRASTITENLLSLDESGYEEPVEGFSIERWAMEQGILLKMAEAMTPLGVAFVRHANGMRTQRNAIIAKRDQNYQTALEQADIAKSSFEMAERHFRASLNLSLSQYRALIEQLACSADIFLTSSETSLKALEAYDSGNEREGNDLWKQAMTEMEQVNDECGNRG